jgi:serum/glucocorticoid-regulated kinase 2
MSSWKLTKKLKELSRSKSPHPKEEDSSIVPTIVAPSGSTGISKTPSSKSSTIVTDGDLRRDTFTPTNLPGELKPDHRLHPTLSHSSSTTVRSAADNSAASTQENLNRFKPGMLTIKIYTGSNFKIPFPINYDKEVLTRLINSGKRNHEDTLLSKLNNLSVADDRLDPKDSSNVVPATVTIPPSIRKNSLIYFTMEFDKTIVSIEAETGTVASPTFNKISQFDVTKVRNELKFQVFLKLPSILLGSETAPQGNQDILISSKTIDLSFENINNPIRLKNHDAVVFDNEYLDFLESTNGDILMSIDYRPNENKHLTIDDFDLLKVIGKGSFGKVMQVRKKDSGKIYALKAIRKSHIVSRSEVTHTLAERTVLARVDNPFIVPLKFSFQSPEKLYLVLSFINGGELFYHLQREGKFELSRARFYTCELLSALECLHSLDVIYRDLKPENILLDYKGHIALCDFGLCKLNMKNQDKTSTFCGTPEYLAPELLLGHGYTKVVDWWTLGILLYEMLTGLPPYYDEDVNTMYRKILTNPLKFPENFDKDAKDLLIGLLSRDPKQRLGNNGAKEIMEHAFFKLINWNKLNSKGYLPPFKPPVKDNFDTSNFDKEFTNEKPVDSVMNDYLSDSVQKQFGGWTYVGTEHLGDSGR